MNRFLLKVAAAAAAKSLQSCPTLCDLIDGSPPGSSIHGIFQARVLEWGAIAFSVLKVTGPLLRLWHLVPFSSKGLEYIIQVIYSLAKNSRKSRNLLCQFLFLHTDIF